MTFLTVGLDALQFGLELALVVCLLASQHFRRYPVFSLYVGATLLADLIEYTTYYHLGWKSPTYRQFYWTDHIALYLVALLVVVSFTYQAIGEGAFRKTAAKVLSVITAAALILPIALLPNHHGKAHGHFDSQWFNHTSQILNFGAAIMNLVLWGALLANRKRDPKLVTLSIGLGIITTAGAIAWGVRQMIAEEHRWILDTFATIANIVALALWCWVLKLKPAPRKTKPLPPAAPPDALTAS